MRFLLLTLLLAACAPDAATPVDTDESGTTGSALATRPSLPVLVNHGGPVLSAPGVYTVVWQGDEADGAIANRCYGALMTTPTWSVLAQYGVGVGSANGVVVIHETPPATLDANDMPALIDRLIDAGTLPVATSQTVYAFLPSRSTAVTLKGAVACQAASCGGFLGYHESTPDGHVYTIGARCNGSFDADHAAQAGHELAEAATDPMPSRNPTWLGADLASEVADLCGETKLPLVTSANDNLAMYALYSNAIAASGAGDPCSSATSTTYANVDVPQVVDLHVDGKGNGAVDVTMTAFADPSVTGVNWYVSGAASCGTGATISFRTKEHASPAGFADGSLRVGASAAFTVVVTGAAPTDASYDVVISVTTGDEQQLRVVQLRVVR